MNYDAVKESLEIRLCDTKENQERLANLVHTEHSDFSAMVQQINQTEVSTEDRLSDHVQHYDRKEAVMENAIVIFE